MTIKFNTCIISPSYIFHVQDTVSFRVSINSIGSMLKAVIRNSHITAAKLLSYMEKTYRYITQILILKKKQV